MANLKRPGRRGHGTTACGGVSRVVWAVEWERTYIVNFSCSSVEDLSKIMWPQISPSAYSGPNRHSREPRQEPHQSCAHLLGSRQRHHSLIYCHQIQAPHNFPGECYRPICCRQADIRSTHSLKTSSISMFLVFTGWTVASAQYAQTGSNPSSTAVIACVNYAFFNSSCI